MHLKPKDDHDHEEDEDANRPDGYNCHTDGTNEATRLGGDRKRPNHEDNQVAAAHKALKGPPQFARRGKVPVPDHEFPRPLGQVLPLVKWQGAQEMQRSVERQYVPHDGDGTPKAPQVSIITWNPGNKRKRKTST